MKKVLILFAIMIMLFMSMINLDGSVFRDDESYIVQIGKNVHKYGYPKSWNEEYFSTVQIGNDFNSNFTNVVLNNLAHYGVAVALFFGYSVFSIRMFFIIIGIIGAFGIYHLTYKLSGNWYIAIIALYLYCFSIPIISYIREANYFSFVLALSMYSYIFYLKVIEKPKINNMILFCLLNILLFHANYMHFVVIVGSQIITYIFSAVNRKNIFRMTFMFIIIIINGIAWYGWSQYYLNQNSSNFRGIENTGIQQFLYQILTYIWNIITNYLPLFLLVPILFILIIIEKIKIKRNDERKTDGLLESHCIYENNNNGIYIKKNRKKLIIDKQTILILTTTIIFNLFGLSFYVTFAATRYLLVAIPFCLISCAYILYAIAKRDKVIATIIIIFLLFTNVIGNIPYFIIKYSNIEDAEILYFIKSPYEYVSLNYYIMKISPNFNFKIFHEGVSDTEGPSKGAVLFLNKFSKPNQTVDTRYGLSQGTITFHTDLKVVNSLYIIDEELAKWMIEDMHSIIFDYKFPNAEKYYQMTYCPIYDIDWIILFPGYEEVAGEVYVKIVKDPNYFECFELVGFPDYNHTNTTVMREPSSEYVYIYRNIRTTEPIDIGNFVYPSDLQ